MVDSLSKFSEYIDPTSLKLPDSTTNFETDPQAMVSRLLYGVV